jgi:hypothetical protein
MRFKIFSKSSSKVSPSTSTEVEHAAALSSKLSHKESTGNAGNVSSKTPSLKTMPSTHSIGNGTARNGYGRSTSAVNQQQSLSTKSSASAVAAPPAIIPSQQRSLHELKYDDEDDEVDPKYLKIVSPTDLTIFKSWYHITPAAVPAATTAGTASTGAPGGSPGGVILISELIDRLIHYHILNPVSSPVPTARPTAVTAAAAGGGESGSVESGAIAGAGVGSGSGFAAEPTNDVDLFLHACQLQPTDYLKFSKFIEVLCETKLYEKKYINRLPSLSHRDSRTAASAAASAAAAFAAFNKKSYSMNYDSSAPSRSSLSASASSTGAASEKKKQQSYLVTGTGDGNGTNGTGKDTGNRKKNKELSRAHTTAGTNSAGASPSPSPSAASRSGIKFPKLPSLRAIGKKDSLKEFFKFAKQFSFDSADEPMLGRQESIDEEAEAGREHNNPTQVPTVLSSEVNSASAAVEQQQRTLVQKQHSINGGEEKSISRRFFGRLLSREYSTKIASVDSMDHEGGGGGGTGENSERRSIASYFRRRDDNVDAAVRRIGKVTIHQQER